MNSKKNNEKVSFILPKIPLNESDLKIIIMDLFIKELIPLPIDSLHLMRIIKRKLLHFENSVFILSRLDINTVIQSLVNENLIIYDEVIICFRKCFYIKAIDLKKLNEYSSKCVNSLSNEILDDEKMKFVILDTINNKKENDNIFKGKHVKENKFKFLSNNYYMNNVNDPLNYNMNLNFYSYNPKKYSIDSVLGYKNSKDINNTHELEDDEDIMNSILFGPSAKKRLLNESEINNDYLELNENENTCTMLNRKYKSNALKSFCAYGNRDECKKRKKRPNEKCELIHFKPVIKSHTDITLGDCSYLDTCRHMDICKFVHYELEDADNSNTNRKEMILSSINGGNPSQWINCDVRHFDLSILGKFSVIMADPPWDIHMDLPYGTLTDDEMKAIKIQDLCEDGIIFLWVTGRASELGRECLEIWGYKRIDELVWIKTNQLQRLIRTGRTGHWLNHSKEHCLVGIKGNPNLLKGSDCDVIVSEVRETSRKPDEIYELIERISPGGRKVEIFARPHNRRHGWISVGNQLPGTYFVEDDVIERFNSKFENNKLTKENMEANKIKSVEQKRYYDIKNDNNVKINSFLESKEGLLNNISYFNKEN